MHVKHSTHFWFQAIPLIYLWHPNICSNAPEKAGKKMTASKYMCMKTMLDLKYAVLWVRKMHSFIRAQEYTELECKHNFHLFKLHRAPLRRRCEHFLNRCSIVSTSVPCRFGNSHLINLQRHMNSFCTSGMRWMASQWSLLHATASI